MAEYRFYFRDDRGAIKARQGFRAQSDSEARELAGSIFDASYDGRLCVSYELWSGRRLVMESGEIRGSSRFEILSDARQELVLETEQRLRDSHWAIGKSERLLQAIEAANNVRGGRDPDGRKGRVLVVEDDEPTCTWLARIIREAGFEVFEAADVLPALAVIQDGNPLRLLVSDIRLPSLSGLALGHMARMVHKSIKSLYVTAYDLPKGEAIVGPVLRKPIAPDELSKAVRAVLAA